MRLRYFPLVVLVLALPMLGSACSPKLASPAAAIMAASQKAETVDSVHFRMSMDMDGIEELELDEETPFDLTFEIEGAIDRAKDRMWLRSSVFGLEEEYRQIDGSTFVSVGDNWVRDDAAYMADTDAFLGFLSKDDPLELVRELGGEATDIVSAGNEEIDGEQWRHLTGNVSGLMGDGFFGDESATFDVWLDSDDWVRKVVLTSSYSFNDPDGSEGLPVARTNLAIALTLELFDYGKPVEVEAPPADEIVSWEEAYGDDYFGDLGDDDWAYEDPFEGADCFGELLSNCFATNPEVDAMAADPALCQGLEARVCLVPVGKVRADVVQAIIDFHRETAGIEVLVLPGIPLTADDVLEDTSQIVDSTLWALMEEHAGVTSYYTPSTHIAITEIDVADDPGGYAWMFGSRWGSGPFSQTHGVFSYFRMLHVEPYDGSPITDELIHERVAKYVGRYTALLHLKFPMDTDIDQLNYYEMYGFGDLDSMGMEWPEGHGTCQGDEPLICIIPDGMLDYGYFGLNDALVAAAGRLSSDLGIRIDVAINPAGHYLPTLPSWSDEYGNDLRQTIPHVLARPNVTVIGVTDDALSQGSEVPEHLDAAWPDERLAIVSVHGPLEGAEFTNEERAYRLLYRAIARARYGLPLTSEPGKLLSDDVVVPQQLDGVPLPALP